MKESTLLSRTFQAQGIRLRLRKEPRASAYRNTSPANSKKRTIEEVDEDEEETAGGAVQRPPSLQRHRSTPQQASVEFAAVHAAGAMPQQATPAGPYGSAPATDSTQSTPPPMYQHPAQGIMMGGRSPQEFVGNTPSPSYYAATLANSPMMPAYTAGPYTTGGFSSGPLPATAFSAGTYSSAGYASAGMASAALSGGQYAAPLAYTSAPPYPALSLADNAITDPQLSVAMPNTSMTGLPMFSEDGTEHAWMNATHLSY